MPNMQLKNVRGWFQSGASLRFVAIAVLTLSCFTMLNVANISQAQNAQPFVFGLWGDMPYAKSNDSVKIPALVKDINDANLMFSIYDGDIKDGSSQCTDDIYTAAISLFNSLKAPVVYVPGDNEWTDCHRTNNGGYDNLERLDHLRSVMFTSEESFGQRRMPLQHQATVGHKYVENTRWIQNRIMFVGLNVPGSNNNRVHDDAECTKKSARTPAQCAADNVEYAERDAANINWLKQSFTMAKSRRAAGVMITIQADPGFDYPETEDIDERTLPNFDGYTAFLDALATETRNFSGQVVLVHGDTHFFKLDKPLTNQANLLPNFTRLQTFGSPNIHWVKVTVNPADRNVFLLNG